MRAFAIATLLLAGCALGVSSGKSEGDRKRGG
jgi:hypothetical protein